MRRDRYYRINQFEAQNPGFTAAYKRVKRMKGFYIHLLVYVVVNAFLIISRFNENAVQDANFWEWQSFSTLGFWGIGLFGHWFSVFGRDVFFGKNWEEKKIQELMEKDKKNEPFQ